MSGKRPAFGWNGAARPRPPAEGFATNVGVAVGSVGPPVPAAEPAPPALTEGSLGGEGPQVEVRKLGEATGPEVTRPSGRIRMTPG